MQVNVWLLISISLSPMNITFVSVCFNSEEEENESESDDDEEEYASDGEWELFRVICAIRFGKFVDS